jgi:hypothetical protein
MSVEIAQALYDQNVSVGLRDVHLPGGFHLNTRRVPVPLVPRRGATRSGDDGPSFCRTSGMTPPSTSTRNGGIIPPTSRAQGAGLVYSMIPSTTMTRIRTGCRRRHRRKTGRSRRRSWRHRCCRWSSTSRRPVGGGGPPTGQRGERARGARELGGPRGAAGRLGVHQPRWRLQQRCWPVQHPRWCLQ